MLTFINRLLSELVLPGMILSFGLCFLFIHIPERDGLKGYRMARRMMGVAYLMCFVALIVEAVSLTMVTPSALQQLIIVTIACLQAFFFTFALTTLIDVQFFTWRRTLFHLPAVLVVPVVAFLLLAIYPDSFFPFLLPSLFYLCLLAFYVIHFRRRYRDYERRMANYFSDDERARLLWVKRSFYMSLFIGILALLYAFRPSVLTSLLFTVVMTCYYAAFAIRFINYAFTFQQIEPAMEAEVSSSDERDPLSNCLPPPPNIIESTINEQLVARLNELMDTRKLYVKSDLTIEELAVLVGESHRTVSTAINSITGLNFKSWVNVYRVEEAQRLIRDGYLSGHTIDALAEAVGFANRVSFYRNFKKHTGQSPIQTYP